MSDNILSDVTFPVGGLLKKVAEGDVFGDPGGPVGADNKASAAASQRARSNPSGIDMQAEAQKAAQRAGVAGNTPGQRLTKSTGFAPNAAPRDHYAPRSTPAPAAPAAAPPAPFTGKVSNND
jgi:hypothetical protein